LIVEYAERKLTKIKSKERDVSKKGSYKEPDREKINISLNENLVVRGKIKKNWSKSNEYDSEELIRLQLLIGGVHPNPGPPRPNLTFITYNCRGLKDINKFRRLIGKINQLIERNSIIALQETHKIEDRLLLSFCKHKYVRNCDIDNKAGVILFFNNSYEITKTIRDNESRFVIVALENPLIKLVVGNVYFPNDHKEAVKFGENYYKQLGDLQEENREHYLVTMGDYNTCFGNEDFINRTNSKSEIDLVKNLKGHNNVCDLEDAYRYAHKEGGFTWSRGNCFSRLDYIFMSSYLMGRIQKVENNWSFEKSDHASVTCELKIEEKVERGPGIGRLNVKFLENEKIKEELRVGIREMINHMIPIWNPHLKLEYVKMSIRSVFANIATEVNRSKKDEINELEIQINNLKSHRVECAKKYSEGSESSEKIEEALLELNSLLNEVRNKYSEDIAFKAGAKWYEEGEKSSKYFLGILKKRTSQKLIDNLVEDGIEISSQNGIITSIKNFYEKLYKKCQMGNTEVDETFFNECPKLSPKNKAEVERDITLDELKATLKGCKESSPGPDGITYKIYKEFWDIIGIYIVESWNYSIATGNLPPSH
jgi:exonuclease III